MERLTNFYSRPCGRGDVVTTKLLNLPVPISTHAPAGGATSGVNKYIYSHTEFLLTPLREGRHAAVRTGPGGTTISTHAPAGGATRAIPPRKRRARHISTHAPAGGATRL